MIASRNDSFGSTFTYQHCQKRHHFCRDTNVILGCSLLPGRQSHNCGRNPGCLEVWRGVSHPKIWKVPTNTNETFETFERRPSVLQSKKYRVPEMLVKKHQRKGRNRCLLGASISNHHPVSHHQNPSRLEAWILLYANSQAFSCAPNWCFWAQSIRSSHQSWRTPRISSLRHRPVGIQEIGIRWISNGSLWVRCDFKKPPTSKRD